MKVVATNRQIARPLKVLVPLIQEELIAGNEAGMEHYIEAGTMLVEARESGQVAYGSWGRWLKHNFKLSNTTATDYMNLARKKADPTFKGSFKSIDTALGREPRRRRDVRDKSLKSLFDVVDKVNVTRLADERKSRDDEIKLHRDLAMQLIDLGYRALATRLHPDRGGSRDAMSRLNTVKAELKEIAATRRFV
jgi:hypothetical protein